MLEKWGEDEKTTPTASPSPLVWKCWARAKLPPSPSFPCLRLVCGSPNWILRSSFRGKNRESIRMWGDLNFLEIHGAKYRELKFYLGFAAMYDSFWMENPIGLRYITDFLEFFVISLFHLYLCVKSLENRYNAAFGAQEKPMKSNIALIRYFRGVILESTSTVNW